MQTFIQDLRYSVSMLLKTPGFSMIVIITLALGIGATTAIFNVVFSVMLKPLPFDEPDRLVMVREHGKNFGPMSIAYPNFLDWRARNKVFEKIGVYRRKDYNLENNSEPELLVGVQMSADLFEALRIKPELGRIYTNDEDKPGGPSVVILSYELWQRRFSGSRSIIGQSITLNSADYIVIGVMPRGFNFPTGGWAWMRGTTEIDVWTTIDSQTTQPWYTNRDSHPGLTALARLRPGVTLNQAQSDMNSVTGALEKEFPDTNLGNSSRVFQLSEVYIRHIHTVLKILSGAVGLVLLIACTNVASLLLAQSSVRRKEIALRSALGASRIRIIRQMLTESLTLAVIGGGAGLLLSQWGVSGILAIAPEGTIPRIDEIKLDKTILLFTILVSTLTSFIFGLVPAWQLSRSDVQEALKETGHSIISSQKKLRSILIVTQIALTMVLLVGAGLMAHSFFRLQHANTGFSQENTLSFKIELSDKKYLLTEPERTINFFNQVKEKIQSLPNVRSVGLSSGLPLGNNGWQDGFTIVGRPDPPSAQTPSMETCIADMDYFKTMGISLLRGRLFKDQDNRSYLKPENLKGKSPLGQLYSGIQSVIIDEEFARRYWPNDDPIGKKISLGRNDDPSSQKLTIVGVVSRVNMEGVRDKSEFVQAYYPFLQFPSRGMYITVKANSDPEQLIASVRRMVQSVDSSQPIFSIRTLEQIRSASIAPDRLIMVLFGVFACISLTLALIGIYGVISWSVNQRVREIGIRMALGAMTQDIMRLVVGGGIKLIIAGIVIGIGGALVLTRLMRSLLFEVSAYDPITFSAIPLLFIVTALVACYIPARRASKVDPMTTLNGD